LLYVSETWALKKEDIRRLEAVEMWMWRRMEKVSWMNKITNAEIMNKVGKKATVNKCDKKQEKNWVAHILRGEGLLIKLWKEGWRERDLDQITKGDAR